MIDDSRKCPAIFDPIIIQSSTSLSDRSLFPTSAGVAWRSETLCQIDPAKYSVKQQCAAAAIITFNHGSFPATLGRAALFQYHIFHKFRCLLCVSGRCGQVDWIPGSDCDSTRPYTPPRDYYCCHIILLSFHLINPSSWRIASSRNGIEDATQGFFFLWKELKPKDDKVAMNDFIMKMRMTIGIFYIKLFSKWAKL